MSNLIYLKFTGGPPRLIGSAREPHNLPEVLRSVATHLEEDPQALADFWLSLSPAFVPPGWLSSPFSTTGNL